MPRRETVLLPQAGSVCCQGGTQRNGVEGAGKLAVLKAEWPKRENRQKVVCEVQLAAGAQEEVTDKVAYEPTREFCSQQAGALKKQQTLCSQRTSAFLVSGVNELQRDAGAARQNVSVLLFWGACQRDRLLCWHDQRALCVPCLAGLCRKKTAFPDPGVYENGSAAAESPPGHVRLLGASAAKAAGKESDCGVNAARPVKEGVVETAKEVSLEFSTFKPALVRTFTPVWWSVFAALMVGSLAAEALAVDKAKDSWSSWLGPCLPPEREPR